MSYCKEISREEFNKIIDKRDQLLQQGYKHDLTTWYEDTYQAPGKSADSVPFCVAIRDKFYTVDAETYTTVNQRVLKGLLP